MVVPFSFCVFFHFFYLFTFTAIVSHNINILKLFFAQNEMNKTQKKKTVSHVIKTGQKKKKKKQKECLDQML